MDSVPVREVRFAVVLYGGVSLAIYMNGIAQELLRMVRGSADTPEGDLDAAELIYRDLGRDLATAGRTRFVIDIISGTSAGGINGVALAKALACGCRDLKPLREAWTDEAAIGLLLNDRGPLAGRGRKAASLLDGAHMYDVLLRTIRRMGEAPGKSLAATLDLFVTTTDLQGRSVPIQLTGASLDEKIHKSVFHFSCDADDPGKNDFTGDSDPMLAFAARCTSSFPVAFPPMRFNDLPAREKAQQNSFAKFFPGDADFEDRQFADGGYLDNRPFSHAIDLIPLRPTALPGERKLIFVDPFPEMPHSPSEAAGEIDFLQNAKLAATTLPRREVIRDDIRAITAINRRLERLSALEARWEKDKVKLAELRNRPGKASNIASLDLADLLGCGYGQQYPLYHHLRVYGATDMLSGVVARFAGYESQSDESTYLRQIVRGWRDSNFAAYHTPGLRTENAFLSDFDIDFRIRRLNHMRAEIDARLRESSEPRLWELRRLVEAEFARFRRLAAAGSDGAGELLDAEAAGKLRAHLAANYRRVMNLPTLEDRRREACEVYKVPEYRSMIDTAMSRIGTQFRTAAIDSSKAVRDALAADDPAGLAAVYDTFHWHDVMTFPFLEGTTASEHSEVQVFRISPADSSLNDSPAKLAGIAAGAFGGFLNRDWREHDILWGRLDGAERIVTALMPGDDAAQAARRTAFIERLQTAILLDEYGPESGRDRRMALLKAKLRDRDVGDEAMADLASSALGVKDAAALDRARFANHYATVKPIGPAPREIAGWSSRAATILSRMIDDLPPTGAIGVAGPRLAGSLRTGGVLTARLARFAMPGSYARLQIEHVLFLAFLAGVLLVAVTAFVSPSLQVYGVLIAAAAVVLFAVIYTFGRVLRGREALPALARRGAAAVALALMALGVWTVWEKAPELLDRGDRQVAAGETG